jgi:hypothetical protein
MKFLGILLIFGGYMLVYSAVAAGGKLATDPWASLYVDAYTEDTKPAKVSKPGESDVFSTGTLPRRFQPNQRLPGQPILPPR